MKTRLLLAITSLCFGAASLAAEFSFACTEKDMNYFKTVPTTDEARALTFSNTVSRDNTCVLPFLEMGLVNPVTTAIPFLNTPLLWAVLENGDLKAVKYAFERYKIKPDSILDSQGGSMGQPAIRNKNANVLEFLLSQGLDPNARDSLGRSLLILAIQNINLDAVKALVKAGASMKQKDANDTHVVLHALLYAKEGAEIAKYLLNAGAPPIALEGPVSQGDWTQPLGFAISLHNYEVVKLLVKKGALKGVDPLKNNYLHHALIIQPEEEIYHYLRFSGLSEKAIDPETGDTLLHRAVRGREPKKVLQLIDGAKVDPNIKNTKGLSPLMTALATCNVPLDLLEDLIKRGANPFTTNNDGQTALHYAATCPNSYMVHFFIMKNLRPNQKDKFGQTPLHLAAASGATETVRQMVELGFDPDVVDNDGNLPLTLFINSYNRPETLSLLIKKTDLSKPAAIRALISALARGRYDVGDELIRAGLKVVSKSANDPGIFHRSKYISKYYPDSTAVRWLIERGANPNAKSDDGTSVLELFLTAENWESIAPLIEKGADPKYVNKDGENAIQIAARVGAIGNVFSYLLLKGVDPLRVDNKGNTLLHHAARNGSLELVERILKTTNIDPFARNSDGYTALDLARKAKQGSIEKQLKYTDVISLLSEIEEGPKGFTKYQSILNDYFKNTQKVDTIDLITLKRALYIVFENGQNKKLKELLPKTIPAHAHPELHALYKHLKAVTYAPYNLTADALAVEHLPAGYYRRVLNAARTPEAMYSHKFKPTAVHVQVVAQNLFNEGKPNAADLEPFAWLLAKSGMSFDEKMLDVFQFNPEELKKDVAAMIKERPLEMKEFSNIAAIKIAKALLNYSDADYECNKKGSPVDEILTWFATYANHKDADRLLYAKLVRMILEKKPVCSSDRNLLLGAMRTWKATNASIQHEIACATTAVFGGDNMKPISERSFADIVAIAEGIGLRADLSEAAWIEQIRAFGEIKDEDPELYFGLTKYVLGNPAGKIKIGSSKLTIAANAPHGGAIVKLCRIAAAATKDDAVLNGTHIFFEKLKSELDKPRTWPKGFQSNVEEQAGTASTTTLRNAFESQGLTDDLVALESDCKTLPAKNKKFTAKSTSAPAPASKKKHTKPKGDFAP